jgi:hypothetical protein
VLIIGAGIFGTIIAIELKKRKIDCVLVEKSFDIFTGASGNNTGRIHLGYHYPRDSETALQSFENAKKFSDRFQKSIFENVANNYFIVKDEKNLTSSENFEKFCQSTKLPIRRMTQDEVEKTGVKINKVEVGFQTSEEICDLKILSNLVRSEIADYKIPVYFGHDIQNVIRVGNTYEATSESATFITEKVIVCTYMQRIGERIFSEYKYENTLVPIVKMKSPRVGNTLMDGPFCSLLPFSKDPELFSVYSVPYSRMDETKDSREQIKKIMKHVSEYFSNLSNVEIVKVLKSKRAIEMRTNDYARRTSEIIKLDMTGDFIMIQSGKLDHVISISKEVCDLVC